MHLWGKYFFKRLGDACGGFVLVDMETKDRHHLKWTRLLDKSSGRKALSKLTVVDRKDVFNVQLWWEVLP